jgi:uncharacterized DUF497 family protein
MTYIVVPETERDLEWDRRKSDRNRLERDLPFDLATEFFRSPTLERNDVRQDYGEIRIRALGIADGVILHCVYTDRGLVRRIISLRPANRRERDAYRQAFHN